MSGAVSWRPVVSWGRRIAFAVCPIVICSCGGSDKPVAPPSANRTPIVAELSSKSAEKKSEESPSTPTNVATKNPAVAAGKNSPDQKARSLPSAVPANDETIGVKSEIAKADQSKTENADQSKSETKTVASSKPDEKTTGNVKSAVPPKPLEAPKPDGVPKSDEPAKPSEPKPAAAEDDENRPPDDAKPATELDLAIQKTKAGEAKIAIAKLIFVLKKEPNLVANRWNEWIQAVQQSSKKDDLYAAIEKIDPKLFQPFPWVIGNLLQQLMQDTKRHEQGIRIFKRAWDAMPEQAPQIIQYVSHIEAIWKMPDVDVYLQKVVLPAPDATFTEPWRGVSTNIISYNANGRMETLTARLLKVLKENGKLEKLQGDIEAARKKFPDWHGGRVLAAIVQSKLGQHESAAQLVGELLDKPPDGISSQVYWMIGQDIDEVPSLRPLAMRSLEAALEAPGAENVEFDYGPMRRLVELYSQAGRKPEARDLLLKHAHRGVEQPNNPEYNAYRKVNRLNSVARQLHQLEYDLDAIRIYREVHPSTELFQASQRMNGDYMRQQIQNGLAEAMRSVKPEALMGLFDGAKPDKGAASLDLLMLIEPAELDKAQLQSLVVNLLRKAATDQPALFERSQTKLAELRSQKGDDVTLVMLAALMKLSSRDVTSHRDLAAVAELKQLAEVLDSTPLLTGENGKALTAEQRVAVKPQIALWLIARECLRDSAAPEEIKRLGVTLGERALGASKLQASNDQAEALAILREWAQIEVDRGEVASAEKLCLQMLAVVQPELAKRLEASKPQAATADPMAELPAPTTLQFDQVSQIARLAVRFGLTELSLQAIRESLSQGPPIQEARNRGAGQVFVQQFTDSSRQVEERLNELELAWRQQGVSDVAIYETLRAAVVPPRAAKSLHLYPMSLGYNAQQSARSAGWRLAQAAATANRGAELRNQIEPLVEAKELEIPARVLLAQLAAAERKSQAADEQLGPLLTLLFVTPQPNQDLIAHAAHAAMQTNPPPDAAVELLEGIVAVQVGRQNNFNEEPVRSMSLQLAKHSLERNRLNEAKQHLANMQRFLEPIHARSGGDYATHRRRELLMQVAGLYAEHRQLAAALESLGQHADLHQNSNYGTAINPISIQRRIVSLLAELPDRERYDLLKSWVLPAAGQTSFRTLAASLPEQQSDIALTAGNVPVSFTTMLIEAARESGRLDELSDLVKPLVQNNTESAKPMWHLIQLARGGAAELAEIPKYVAARIAAIDADAAGNHRTPLVIEDLVIARELLNSAARQEPARREISRQAGAQLARKWNSHAQRIFDHAAIVHSRRAVSLGEVARIPNQHYPPMADPKLSHWISGTLHGASLLAPGATPAPWWVAHEGMIAHLGGSAEDVLFFAYPLTGTFEVSADCYAAGWGEANLSYGGLMMETIHGGYQTAITAPGGHDRIGTHDPIDRFDDFNHVKIQVEPGQLRLIVNNHLVYHDRDIGPTSPWFGLSPFIFQTAFKNIRIHGDPVIPREVLLSADDRLEGWVSQFYNETRPPRRSVGRTDWTNRYSGRTAIQRESSRGSYDWSAEAGVIHGRRLTDRTSASNVVASRLFYHRPLRQGETWRYEFFFDPLVGLHVHPTLGRLAFLLEPNELRVFRMGASRGAPAVNNRRRAVPQSEEEEGSFLDADEYRRGPDALPLKPGSWNGVELSLAEGVAKLSLNGVVICEKPFAATHDLHFGFFHDKSRTAAKIRNVRLSGDWPTSLAPELRTNLLVRSDSPDVATRQAMSAAVGEVFHSKSVRDILNVAAAMLPGEQFEFLTNWVLPSDDHLSWRLFTELEFVDWNSKREQDGAGAFTDASGHEFRLIGPALELADLAMRLNKVEEFAARFDAAVKRVAETRGLASHDERSIEAFRVLIALTERNRASAEASLAKLFKQYDLVPQGELEQERWPELFAVYAAMRDPQLLETAEALAAKVVSKQTSTDHAGANWEYRVRHARDWCRSRIANSLRPWPLKQWTPRTIRSSEDEATAVSPRWEFVDGEVTHRSGRGIDYLFFQSPLRGKFQVEADVATFDWRETALFFGGTWARPRYDLRFYETGGLFDQRAVSIEPPLGHQGDWCRTRLESTGDRWVMFVNDRKIHDQPLGAGHDPWLAVRTNGHLSGGVRNVRITGQPTIPDELQLTSGDSLHSCGWFDHFSKVPPDNVYEPNGATRAKPVWEKLGDEIRGQRLGSDFADSMSETLLEYHRPLAEDGEVTYEFMFEPGQTVVHPALGRVALLLNPEGVGEHVVTHGACERRRSATSGELLLPDNVTIEKSFRRGLDALPLKADEWNRVRLTIKGEILSLTVNDVLVYERPTGSPRSFGLFRFADQSAARVRDVRFRGNWPKSLPDIKLQELAFDSLGTSLAEIKWPYSATWNFRDPRPDAFAPSHDFKQYPKSAELTQTGMKFKLSPGRDFPGDLIGFSHNGHVRGDFEIIGRFKIHRLDKPSVSDQWKTPGFDFGARRADTEHYLMTTHRFKSDPFGSRELTSMRGWTDTGNQPRLDQRDTPWTATSGRHRIVRKGSTAYYLTADGDSGDWRLIDKKRVDTDDIDTVVFFVRNFDVNDPVEIELQELTVNAAKYLSPAAVLKERAARAEFRDGELPVKWSWNFQGKLPEGVTPIGAALNHTCFAPSAEGLRISLPAGRELKEDLVGFELGKRLQGDFEVIGRFSQLSVKRSVKAVSFKVPGIDLAVRLDPPLNEWLRLERRHFEDRERGQALKVSQSVTRADGQLIFTTWQHDWPATAGRLKIVRKGSKIYYLAAADNSTEWQFLRETSASDTPVDRIHFATRNYDPDSTAEVLLQELTIHAAR